MIKLREHQERIVAMARTQPNLALFCDPGTGKTGAMIRILAEDYNKNGIRPTLVFAPLTVCKQWASEFVRFSKVPENKILILTGPGQKRVENLQKARAVTPNLVVVTNYEAVQIEAFYKELLKFSPKLVILDESHRIKDSGAKRSKAIYPLCQAADRRFLLTGTPFTNDLTDIFGQYKALDPTLFGGGFWSFRQRYFYDRNAGKNFGFPDWQPHTWAAKEIGEILSKTSFQIKASECLDLPPLNSVGVEVGLSHAQEKAYNEMRKEFLTEVNGLITTAEFEMTKTLRMQQILAGFTQPDEKEEANWFSDVPRLNALMERIDSIGKEQFIIWTVFRPTYAKLAKLLEKAGIKAGLITGEQSEPQKQEAKQAFMRGDVQAIVANPAAASEGIDGLQCSKYAFYYMRGHSLLHYEQSYRRNYRSGSEVHDKVTHFHFYAKGTLDEAIAYALLNKKKMSDVVLSWAKGQDFSCFV